jgi:hypothetical protein
MNDDDRPEKTMIRLNPTPLSSIVIGLSLAICAAPTPSSINRPPQDLSSPQQSAPALAGGKLSKPSHTASFPASVWFDARSPIWANGHFAKLTLGDFPAGIEVYDRNAKLVSQTYVSIPGATQLWLVGAIPTSDGGAIASGQFSNDEETTYFLARTSPSGGVVSTLRTQTFIAARMCQANDGTIWTLGRDPEKESAKDTDYALVRQFSFEKGLLHTYVPRSSVNLSNDGTLGAGEGPSSAFLSCGKDRISIFFNQTDEYFEIDPSKETLRRWKMSMAPLADGRVTGLTVTDAGRVYASLFEIKNDTDIKTHGLFELRAEPNVPTGEWLLINDTLNSQPRLDDAPRGSFFRLWGADNEDLLIRRLFDPDISWVRVVNH